MKPPGASIALGLAATVLVALAVVGIVTSADARWVLGSFAAATALAGSAAVRWAAAADHGGTEEPRRPTGPGRTDRRRLFGLGAGAAVVTAGALAVPAARRVEVATERLRSTSWRAGTRLVEPDGRPVLAADIPEGDLLTVYPEGAEGEASSQAVVIREPPERFVPDAERPDWVVDGIAVYSKLCTHMACPLGLYQQQSGTLLCPCHQAVFDVLDGGRAVQGPARRALPRLPVEVDDDGYLVALGDFSETVGTGFWGRP